MSTTELTTTETTTALVPRASEEAIAQLEAIAGECQHMQRAALSAMQRTFRIAAAARALNQLITDDMMEDVMSLQNTPVGFLVAENDKAGNPINLPVATVKRVMIEATIKGLRMVGNEVNVFAGGKVYAAQAGLMRLVREWPGISDIRVNIYPSESRGQHRVVQCRASFVLDGETRTFDFTGNRAIPIRVNAGMGEDAIQGKAKRKLFAKLYESLCGVSHELVEDDNFDTVDVPGNSKAATAELLAELPQSYRDKLAACPGVLEVNGVAREIAMDATLSAEARREGDRAVSDRRNEIKSGRGERSNPPANGNGSAAAPEAFDAGVVAERMEQYGAAIEQAKNRGELTQAIDLAKSDATIPDAARDTVLAMGRKRWVELGE